MYPKFFKDPRNVRIGLCTNGFAPFGQYVKTYSCCPAILTLYNLPHSMSMKGEIICLTIINPGPNNAKSKIDVHM